MPAKRKRPGSVTLSLDGKDDSNDAPSPTPPPSLFSKKRKKSLQYDPAEICHELYETIRNFKTDDGRLLCEAFIRVPKRRSAPDYYDVVSIPIDLLKIQQKLKMEEYDDLEQMSTDIELMVNNAKAYYKKPSQEYKDACDLWELYNDSKTDLISEVFGDMADGEAHAAKHNPTVEPDTEVKKEVKEETVEQEAEEEEAEDGDLEEDNDYEELFAAVMLAKDGDRELSAMFQLLPPRSKYPEYYDVIRDPIDLRMIAQRVQGNQFESMPDMEQDLMLMVRNAKVFNEPGSQIYKDAETLRKLVKSKKTEIENRRAIQPAKLSERIRCRERAGSHRLSAVVAALAHEDDEDADSNANEDIDDDDADAESFSEEEHPMWLLFYGICKYKNTAGQSLAEPFLKLPNRRFYPDYYKEIKKPMSLLNIRKRLKHNQYKFMEELVNDMDLVFINAKRYNKDESMLYRYASQLQKMMKEKVKQLDGMEITKDFDFDELPPIYDCPFVKCGETWGEDEDSNMSAGTAQKTPSTKKRPSIGPASLDLLKKPRVQTSPEDVVRKRCWALYKVIYDYTDHHGRTLRDIFLQLPLKKDYPDYYQVILEPIDMTMVENKIRLDKYASPEQLIAEFEIMFHNARSYNEESSQVYKDADTLERVLRSKWKQFHPCFDSPGKKTSKLKLRSKTNSPLTAKLNELLNTIKDYADTKGRVLSPPFLKLPLKSEYPDYYEVIKKPVDLQKIQMKLTAGQYDTLEEMVADFVQVFDNACKYNEPDALIYKDALTLQRVCLEKKAELVEDGINEVPDVRSAVQELMTNLFIAVYNHQDEEGRCYSDSFAELPENHQGHDAENTASRDLSVKGLKHLWYLVCRDAAAKKPISFDRIKINLDKGRYRRMDRFQEDLFCVFERARRLSRSDSQLYEDAVEIQQYFIKSRDEMCKNGDILLTPALSYMEKHLQNALDVERKEKVPKEQAEDEEKHHLAGESEEIMLLKSAEEAARAAAASGENENSIRYKDETFHMGDFVYVAAREPTMEPHIFCIDKLYRAPEGDQMLYGNWFYRPNETYHVATRKFLQKEVMRSDVFTSVPITQIVGKCFILSVKEYFKMRPEGFDDTDVYVCENRYNHKCRFFKKIKVWGIPRHEDVKLLERESILTPVRVASIFAEKTMDDDLDITDSTILDKSRQNVVCEKAENIPAHLEDGFVYYEQYNIPSGAYKLGDSVYVRSHEDRPYIARIDRIWTDKNGHPYFYGPWFVKPIEVEHSPTRLFFKNEVFLSSIEDSNPMHSMLGKCSVLYLKDYCSSRSTEVAEQDVFICECKYNETERSIKKLGKGLKKYTLSPKVTDDEIYFFRKHISPDKQEPSPLLMRVSSEDSFMEAEMPHTPSNESLNDSQPAVPEEPTPVIETPAKKKKPSNKRTMSGYIVFAGEIRKVIQKENPECTFGDISRIVGTRWRALERDKKEIYEEKSRIIGEQLAAKKREAEEALNESMEKSGAQGAGADQGHTSPAAKSAPGTSHQGHAHGQTGVPVQGVPTLMTPAPFPLQPLYEQQHNGMRALGSDFHGGMASSVTPRYPSHYYPHPASGPGHPGVNVSYASPMSHTGPQHIPPMPFPPAPAAAGQTYGGMANSGTPAYAHSATVGLTHQAVSYAQSGAVPAPGPPPGPMFVSVPPRTQRLLHSEAYLRYIEGLTADSHSISDWERTLSATQDNTQPKSINQLPVHWLDKGAGYHDNVVNALWALRDLMLKDTLNITRTLQFEDLSEAKLQEKIRRERKERAGNFGGMKKGFLL